MGASYQEVEATFNFYKEKIDEIRETPWQTIGNVV
jgi:hypothetical protein